MIMKKDVIIKGEIFEVIPALQNFDDINIDELVQITKNINEKYKNNLDEFILKTKTVKKEK